MEGRLAIAKGYVLHKEDRLRAQLIQAIMCSGRVDMDLLERSFEIDFIPHFVNELGQLRQFADDGLIELEPRAIVVAPRGRLFLRNIAMVFDHGA